MAHDKTQRPTQELVPEIVNGPRIAASEAVKALKTTETAESEETEETSPELDLDPETCQAKWLTAQDRVDELNPDDRPARLPKLGILETIVLLLAFLSEYIRPQAPAALLWISLEKRPVFEEALERLEDDALALLHAEGMRNSLGPLKDQQAREAFTRSLKRAEDLRFLGFHWLDVLVIFGRLDETTVKAIRAGRGQIDLASDLVTISAHLTEHWAFLEPLVKREKREAFLLDHATIDAMGHEGMDLLRTIGGSSPTNEDGIDWRDQVISLYALLERDYAVVYNLLTFFHQMTGNTADLGELRTLSGLYRRSFASKPSRRSGKGDKATPIDETKPDEPKPDEPTPGE
jgi:hypothetical protein